MAEPASRPSMRAVRQREAVRGSEHDAAQQTGRGPPGGAGALRREDINVVVAFCAMGLESDQEVVGLVGPQPGLAALLGASLQEAKAQGILIRQQALEYIGAGGLLLHLHSLHRRLLACARACAHAAHSNRPAMPVHAGALQPGTLAVVVHAGCPWLYQAFVAHGMRLPDGIVRMMGRGQGSRNALPMPCPCCT